MGMCSWNSHSHCQVSLWSPKHPVQNTMKWHSQAIFGRGVITIGKQLQVSSNWELCSSGYWQRWFHFSIIMLNFRWLKASMIASCWIQQMIVFLFWTHNATIHNCIYIWLHLLLWIFTACSTPYTICNWVSSYNHNYPALQQRKNTLIGSLHGILPWCQDTAISRHGTSYHWHGCHCLYFTLQDWLLITYFTSATNSNKGYCLWIINQRHVFLTP